MQHTAFTTCGNSMCKRALTDETQVLTVVEGLGDEIAPCHAAESLLCHVQT
jgi:hypothetical protein